MVFQHRPNLGFAVSLGWVSRSVVDYVTFSRIQWCLRQLSLDFEHTWEPF
jgi:hypothetical protein